MLKKGKIISYAFYFCVRVCVCVCVCVSQRICSKAGDEQNKKTKGILHIYHVLIFPAYRILYFICIYGSGICA
jgi:hypothetical protein